MQVTVKSMPEAPDSQAQCPTCKKVVRCYMLEYVKIFMTWHLILWHSECDTTWKVYL